MIGTIISVSDLNVKVLLNDPTTVKIGDILVAKTNKVENKFEVVEVVGNVAKTIPFDNVIYLKKGIEVSKSDEPLSIEYSDQLLGRVFNSYGDLIDGTTIKKPKKRNMI